MHCVRSSCEKSWNLKALQQGDRSCEMVFLQIAYSEVARRIHQNEHSRWIHTTGYGKVLAMAMISGGLSIKALP